MHIPHLFDTKKPPGQRPRTPVDTEEYVSLVRQRFSRAYGVFGLAKRSLGQNPRGQCNLGTFKQDCLMEVTDALASDAYRAFLEREFDVRFRLDGGALVLHAVRDDDLAKLEDELVGSYERRLMERAFAFGFDALHKARETFAGKADATSWDWELPSDKSSPDCLQLRRIMADFAAREDLQRRMDCKLAFQATKRVSFYRNRTPLHPGLRDQLVYEGLLRGT